MSQNAPSLDDYRREIDAIDDGIHDLLMRRAEAVSQIGQIKARERSVVFRPAREAQILRRLVGRHQGSLPAQVIVRVWREVLSALTRLQGPFAVAVYVPEERRGYWDVARDHFGGLVPMNAVNSPLAAVRAVSEGTASVAVVPFPAEDDSDSWWRFLVNGEANTPRIVARLPFAGHGNARGEDRDAVVVGFAPHEASGADCTMLGVEVGGAISRGRLKDLFDAVGLPASGVCTWHTNDPEGPAVHLVEVRDFVAPGDARIEAVIARFGDTPVRITTLGGYAIPFTLHTDGR
jgi:chorismate mutase / prephenate dehydratase